MHQIELFLIVICIFFWGGAWSPPGSTDCTLCGEGTTPRHTLLLTINLPNVLHHNLGPLTVLTRIAELSKHSACKKYYSYTTDQ